MAQPVSQPARQPVGRVEFFKDGRSGGGGHHGHQRGPRVLRVPGALRREPLHDRVRHLQGLVPRQVRAARAGRLASPRGQPPTTTTKRPLPQGTPRPRAAGGQRPAGRQCAGGGRCPPGQGGRQAERLRLRLNQEAAAAERRSSSPPPTPAELYKVSAASAGGGAALRGTWSWAGWRAAAAATGRGGLKSPKKLDLSVSSFQNKTASARRGSRRETCFSRAPVAGRVLAGLCLEGGRSEMPPVPVGLVVRRSCVVLLRTLSDVGLVVPPLCVHCVCRLSLHTAPPPKERKKKCVGKASKKAPQRSSSSSSRLLAAREEGGLHGHLNKGASFGGWLARWRKWLLSPRSGFDLPATWPRPDRGAEFRGRGSDRGAGDLDPRTPAAAAVKGKCALIDSRTFKYPPFNKNRVTMERARQPHLPLLAFHRKLILKGQSSRFSSCPSLRHGDIYIYLR